MEHLFRNWDKLKDRVRGSYLFLFLDYDGTLSPIVSTPDKAVIPLAARNLLKEISQNSNCKIAIISGRSLADIRNRVGIKEIVYSGNHGLELKGPKIKYNQTVSADYKKVLSKIRAELELKLKDIDGAIIEDKGLALAVHFRLAGKKNSDLIKAVFREVVLIPSVAKKIKIRCGKKVLEAGLPIEWDKGKIVLWLLSRQKFIMKDKNVTAIYIGDDTTDEDAFRALKKEGITVFVGGNKPSSAQYYLNNSKEVYDFLGRILNNANKA
ncbi:MAG: trehalose-phosphatase [Candidatus Omnitrophica bacterium]|jgi:trehalose-phosphatase|nr:trehalose-phosphatase [Candidatus Omnitrophota bacterium]MDD3987788.1 trehalose-phosphatase [Candidatus Omnitrophota bacterium]MDD4981453.1 trehalose-phosphatase [Candidatus Omnitrophota bacterium]MDD5665250.1 trehalose-phosphatase [Candidatus Omnitrophota bacterium]